MSDSFFDSASATQRDNLRSAHRESRATPISAKTEISTRDLLALYHLGCASPRTQNQQEVLVRVSRVLGFQGGVNQVPFAEKWERKPCSRPGCCQPVPIDVALCVTCRMTYRLDDVRAEERTCLTCPATYVGVHDLCAFCTEAADREERRSA